MSAPDDGTLGYFPGASSTPTNNSAALGGAISAVQYVETDPNHLIHMLSIPSSTGEDVDYHGIFYRKNLATGPLTDAWFDNRTAGIANSAAGVVQVQSTSSLDTGTVRTTGLVGAAFQQGDVVCTGTTAAVGSKTFDASGIWRPGEYLVGGAAATPYGDITISVNGQIIGVIYGSLSGRGNIMCTREFSFALATAQNTTLSSANRLTAPTGIGAFTNGARWTGLDQSVTVPGGDLNGSSHIGGCVKLTVKKGIQPPVAGYVLPDIGIHGFGAIS